MALFGCAGVGSTSEKRPCRGTVQIY